MLVITQQLLLQRASDHSIKLELKLYRKREIFHSLQSPPSLTHTHTAHLLPTGQMGPNSPESDLGFLSSA